MCSLPKPLRPRGRRLHADLVAQLAVHRLIPPPTLETIMIKFALFARLEAKPGKEAAVREFLEMGLALANQESTTPIWFALKLSEGTFVTFESLEEDARLGAS